MLEFFFEFFQMKNFDLHAELVRLMIGVRKKYAPSIKGNWGFKVRRA
jgi:hypothetical protein